MNRPFACPVCGLTFYWPMERTHEGHGIGARDYPRRPARKSWEYRGVVEVAMGRSLRRGEIVHHIDGDESNDARSNLLVCDRKYHRYLHGAMERNGW